MFQFATFIAFVTCNLKHLAILNTHRKIWCKCLLHFCAQHCANINYAGNNGLSFLVLSYIIIAQGLYFSENISYWTLKIQKLWPVENTTFLRHFSPNCWSLAKLFVNLLSTANIFAIVFGKWNKNVANDD